MNVLCTTNSGTNSHITLNYLKEASDTNSTFAIWNKQFKNNGLFESHINPYNFKPKALRKIDLKPLERLYY